MNTKGSVNRESLGPSNSAAAPRALLLIAVAIILGLVLLWKGLDSNPGSFSISDSIEEDSISSVVVSEEEDPTVTEEVPSITTTTATTTTTTTTIVAARPPNQVRVLVANGSGIPRGAATITDRLSPAGYTTLPPANAIPTSRSIIYYEPTYSSDARAVMNVIAPGNPDLLAQMPSGGPEVPENAMDRVLEAHVVVILGSDSLIIR